MIDPRSVDHGCWRICEFLFLALPQNLWVDSDWFSVAFQGWHDLEVFAHAESRARNFFRHPLLRPMIFCI